MRNNNAHELITTRSLEKFSNFADATSLKVAKEFAHIYLSRKAFIPPGTGSKFESTKSHYVVGDKCSQSSGAGVQCLERNVNRLEVE